MECTRNEQSEGKVVKLKKKNKLNSRMYLGTRIKFVVESRTFKDSDFFLYLDKMSILRSRFGSTLHSVQNLSVKNFLCSTCQSVSPINLTLGNYQLTAD